MAITYTTIPPPKYLAPYVRFYWVLESDAPYTHRRMADVSPELIFHYKGQFDALTSNGDRTPSFRSGIHGQSRSISRFTIDSGFGIFGVYLYPYTLPALFNIKASVLTDQMLDLESLWNNEGRRLDEQMMLAEDNHQRIQLVTDFLIRKLRATATRNPPPVFSSVQFILNTGGTVPVEEVADKYGVSDRQLIRQFKEFTGLTPKLFSRITRFHTALQKYDTGRQSLTEIALDCGYYDQSHFIHDFKAFSGHLPKTFFSGEAEGTDWRDGA